jgi:uncharacterized membrane protein YheB (UPF0754 family)
MKILNLQVTTMGEILQKIFNLYYQNFEWQLLLMPLIAGIIGWGTNVLALKMTFYPLEYIGFKWKGYNILGWQGIVPEKAGKMASKAVDMITTKLIDIEDQFSKINPKVVAKEMEPRMLDLTRQIFEEAMSQEIPMWKLLTAKQKDIIFQRAVKEIPKVTEEVMEDVKNNITDIFNLKKMAVDQLTQNKNLLNKIFLEVGHKEFKFIEYSGFIFGGLFGIFQVILWIPFPYWWSLPLSGLIVGYLTNFLALKLIFNPVEPIYFLGLRFQGLFIQRQKEVSKGYSRIIAENIMTMPKIFDAIFYGPASDRLVQIIERHVNEGIDNSAGYSSALIRLTSGSESFDRVKNIACRRLVEEIPEHIHLVFDYAKQALDIEHTLNGKMSELPPDEFVGFLRPVFQEDEWKLILVGAILGMIAGFPSNSDYLIPTFQIIISSAV